MGSNVFNDLDMTHFFDTCSQTCDKLVINIHKVCYIRDTLKGTTSQISNKNKDQRLVYISQGRDKNPFSIFCIPGSRNCNMHPRSVWSYFTILIGSLYLDSLETANSHVSFSSKGQKLEKLSKKLVTI